MAKCSHCDGTGEAPERATLECVGCQRAVTVTWRSTAEALRKCENVRCADCKKAMD